MRVWNIRASTQGYLGSDVTVTTMENQVSTQILRYYL